MDEFATRQDRTADVRICHQTPGYVTRRQAMSPDVKLCHQTSGHVTIHPTMSPVICDLQHCDMTCRRHVFKTLRATHFVTSDKFCYK